MKSKVLKYRIGSVCKQSIWGIVAQLLIITSENHIPLLWTGGGGGYKQLLKLLLFSFIISSSDGKHKLPGWQHWKSQHSYKSTILVGIPETELMSIYTFAWPSAWLCYTSKVAWSVRTSSGQSFVHLIRTSQISDTLWSLNDYQTKAAFSGYETRL